MENDSICKVDTWSVVHGSSEGKGKLTALYSRNWIKVCASRFTLLVNLDQTVMKSLVVNQRPIPPQLVLHVCKDFLTSVFISRWKLWMTELIMTSYSWLKCLFKLAHNWNYNVRTSSCHICFQFFIYMIYSLFQKSINV